MATYKHIRSNVDSKRPTTSLADGQVAINTNAASPGVFFKDSAGTGIVKVGPVHVGTTAPNSTPGAGGSTGNSTGEQWLDTSLTPAQLKVWNGSAWVGVVADELPVSKLQDGAAYQLLHTDSAGTGVEWTSNIDIPGTLDVTGAATFDSTINGLRVGRGAGAVSTNIAVGATALNANTTGADNTAVGYRALLSNTTGYTNQAFGYEALKANTVGAQNSSFGAYALKTCTAGNYNTAVGYEALKTISTGNSSTAVGVTALKMCTGTNNIGIGYEAGVSLTTGSNNTIIGGIAGTAGLSDTVIIGAGTTERLRIDSSGNVGINESSPDRTLHVRKDGDYALKVGGESGAAFYLELGQAGASASPGINYVGPSASLRFLNNGSDVARFDSSGRFGIGTSSPAHNLDISPASGAAELKIAGAEGEEASIRLYADQGDDSADIKRLLTDTSGNFKIQHYSGSSFVDSMVIDSSGNVGIGTSSPSDTLHLNGATGYGLKIADSSSHIGVYRTHSDGAILKTASNHALLFGTNDTERMRIDSSGNVLIGGTTPATADIALNANGNITTAGYIYGNGSGSYLVIERTGATGSTSVAEFGGDTVTTRFTADGSITAAGQVTSTNSSYGFTSNATSFPFTAESTLGNGGKAFYAKHTGTSSSSRYLFYGENNAGEVFRAASDGSITCAGTVTANGTVLTSDQRFKENITPANPQLADIEALGAQLKNFNWNADAPSSNDTRQLGLIAQDAETVCPGIVKTIARTKQGAELTPELVVPAVYETRTVPAVLDEEGEVVEAETTEQVLVTEEQVTPATYEELDDSYKGISHDALIMKLLGAVAELSAEVAALKAG